MSTSDPLDQANNPIRPNWISNERWSELSAAEQVAEAETEAEAEAMLSGPHREFMTLDTLLVWECFKAGIMSVVDIRNYPQPAIWSIEQCRAWCEAEGDDFCGSIETAERVILQNLASQQIRFGLDEIPDEVLRRILRKLMEDQTEKGLALWRSHIEAGMPDIYEWWCIEYELAEDLIEIGEAVLVNKFGHWWGRQSGNMPILMDGALQCVARLRSERDAN